MLFFFANTRLCLGLIGRKETPDKIQMLRSPGKSFSNRYREGDGRLRAPGGASGLPDPAAIPPGPPTIRVALTSGPCTHICTPMLWSLPITHVSKLCLILYTEPQIFTFTQKCASCDPESRSLIAWPAQLLSCLSEADRCFNLASRIKSKPDSKRVQEKLREEETDGRMCVGGRPCSPL